MEIKVNPADMTRAQREYVAGFILGYPTQGSVNCEIAESTAPIVVTAADVIAQRDKTGGTFMEGKAAAIATKELEALHHEHVTTMPAASFTVDPVAAAFGSAPVPFVPVSTPSIVVPPPPAPTAQTLQTPGPVSLGADAVPGGSESAPFAHIATAPGMSPALTANGSGSAVAQMATNTVTLDVNGLPWDGRIHAESKAKIADGSWRSKRNLDPAVKASVEAELRQVMGAPVAAPLAVPTATTQVPAPPVTVSSPTTTASPPVAPAPDARQVFVQLVGRSAAAISTGKLTQQEVTACCVAAGVPMLPLLANRLDLVESVAAAIDAIVASRA